MGRKTDLSPRKLPRQARARSTVDAILQATTYILASKGWGALTTNAIAELAGVNIASLYQYFPNKAAVVAELRRRYLDRVGACHSPTKRPETLREVLRASVENEIREYRASPELHRVFAEELPRSTRLVLDPRSSSQVARGGARAEAGHDRGPPERRPRSEQPGRNLGDSRLELGADHHRPERGWYVGPDAVVRGVPDLELAGFIARTATRAVIREAAAERPKLLDDALFASELVTLLERYLARDSEAQRAPVG